MTNNTWIFDVGSAVYAKLSYTVGKDLASTYKNLQFTTSDRNSITSFPTVYYNELDTQEVASDLEGNQINAVTNSVQIEIYSDKSQEVCNKVAKKVVEFMLSEKYILRQKTFNNESTTYKLILRFSRKFGSEDKM